MSLGWPGNASGPPGRAGGSVWGEGSLGISAQTAASATRSRTAALPSCRGFKMETRRHVLRETVPLYVGELRLALRPIRRAHPTLPETHRSQTLQVRRLQPLLLALRSPGPAHEAPPEL
ncbi:hypothetical protein L3Q82_022566, partial [Scortum barcoo]